ncbi:TPA: hypothetical protein ACKE3D_004117, partial [Burkholderia dolosa]
RPPDGGFRLRSAHAARCAQVAHTTLAIPRTTPARNVAPRAIRVPLRAGRRARAAPGGAPAQQLQ